MFGIEADISALSADDTESITTNVPSFFPETLTASQDLRWLATVRARAGYAMGNWLLFATGGFAFGKVDYSYSFSCPSCGANVVASSADSSTETGWTAGGGAEYAFGKWSLKGEYLYFDLGDQNFRAEPTADGTPVSSFGFNWHNTANFETAGSIARVALNYHLD